MVTNEVNTKKGFSPTQSIAMAVICLVVVLALGYVIRRSHLAKNVAPAAMQSTAVAGLPNNVPIPPAELKRMADEESKPLLDKLKSDPKNPAALAQLGDLRFDAGQYKEAITYYEQSLALDPKNTRVRADMANAYAYTGAPDRAISEYQTALKYDPKHGLSLLNMGMVQWHDKGDANAAIATWEKLLKVNPQFAQQVQVDKLIAKAKEHLNMPAPTQSK